MMEPCQFLSWDTDFFGHRIARVVGHRLDPQRVQAILAWCRDREIECLYFLADSDDPGTIRLAEDHGFRLVDIRITLQCEMQRWLSHRDRDRIEAAVHVRPSRSSDIPALQTIAQDSHRDSRFYSDPCFSTESCQALYAVWIRRSCEGYADRVFVPEVDGQPVGYVSCHLLDTEPRGLIGLVGVADRVRGQGIGHLLVTHALVWFAEHDVKSVNVVTQGRNVVAQRLYQRCGFLPHSVQLWYHKWMSDFSRGKL